MSHNFAIAIKMPLCYNDRTDSVFEKEEEQMNKELKILVVNDDGVTSPGIERLAANAAKFGRVWVVAPEKQCSAMSQKLTIFDNMELKRVDFPVPVEAAYSLNGTPVDCVKVAVKMLLPEKPDVVFSGINFGYNAGMDIAYSGTVGATMEAVINGIPAIAFSSAHDGSFDVTDKYIQQITEELLNNPLPSGQVWNVNFPGCPLNEYKGILRDRKIAQLCFFENCYELKKRDDGGEEFIPYSDPKDTGLAAEGTDIRAVLDGYISIGKIASMVVE